MSTLTAEQRILASALDVVTAVTERNLANKTGRPHVLVPRYIVQELAERIEAVHPGLIADVRRRQGDG